MRCEGVLVYSVPSRGVRMGADTKASGQRLRNLVPYRLCATGIPRAQRDGLVLGSSPARSPRRSSRASGQEKGKASKRELRGSFAAALLGAAP